MNKIAFIINGKVDSYGLRKKITTTFSESDTKVFTTDISSDGRVKTEAALAENFFIIVCVGGDGTLNEVVNGIMSFQTGHKLSSQTIKLGLLPYGSGNDFSKSINIRFDLNSLKKRIEQNLVCPIDLGLVSFQNVQQREEKRYFVNIADIGLGGIVSQRVNRSSKFFGAFLTYQFAIVKSLIFYRYQKIKAVADTRVYTGPILNYIIANGKYFGSGLAIAPDAKPNDGIFSIVIVGRVSLPFYLKSLSDIRKGKHIHHPEVFYESARDVSVDSEKPQPIDMDGEFIGTTPMRLKLVENAVFVYY